MVCHYGLHICPAGRQQTDGMPPNSVVVSPGRLRNRIRLARAGFGHGAYTPLPVLEKLFHHATFKNLLTNRLPPTNNCCCWKLFEQSLRAEILFRPLRGIQSVVVF